MDLLSFFFLLLVQDQICTQKKLKPAALASRFGLFLFVETK